MYIKWKDRTSKQKKIHLQAVNHWRKSENGLICYTYHKQRDICRRRGKKMPNYSLSELKAWALTNPKFNRVYRKWVKGGYLKNEKPSFDRIDCFGDYSLENLQILTWLQNNKKGRKETWLKRKAA